MLPGQTLPAGVSDPRAQISPAKPDFVALSEGPEDFKLPLQVKPVLRATWGLSEATTEGIAGGLSREGEKRLSGFQRDSLGRKEQVSPQGKVLRDALIT